jgi:hypothetical protein
MPRSLAPSAPENPQAIAADPVLSARLAGLRHVTDERPGIRRRRQGALDLLRKLPAGEPVTKRGRRRTTPEAPVDAPSSGRSISAAP